jgi:hypothetical protein
MTSSRYGFGLSVALSLASFGFLYSAPLQAQEEAPPAPPPAGEDPAAKAADQAEANEQEEAESEAAPEPALTKPEPGVKPEDKPQEPPPPPENTASQTSAAREIAVSMVGVERLPGSAYPAVQTRGIKYGSLWSTFHGQQWPYMPRIQGEDSLRIGLSGSIWNDLSYAHIDADERLKGANVNDQTRWTTQTRGVLRVTPTYSANDDWFVQGNAEFVVQGNMRPDPGTGVLATTDDLWVRVGKWDVFDFTVGRFQGWEIANHYGMALDQNTLERQGAWIVTSPFKPTDGYGLSYFWDRQDNLLGAYAAHVYPTKYLRAEVLGHFGAGSNSFVFNPYQVDVRPAAIFDIGWLKLKAGYEYGKVASQEAGRKDEDERNGYGFAAQFVLDPYVEFGGSFARGFEDVVDKDGQADLNGSNTVQTFGGFLNASPGYKPLVFGFGAFRNSWEDLRIDNAAGPHYGKVDTNDQWLLFGAVQYTLWEQLYFKFVVSHASNKAEHFKDGTYINDALSTRFRVTVLF